MSSDSKNPAQPATDPEAGKAPFPDVGASTPGAGEASFDRVNDLNVPITVELGRTQLSVQDILRLAPGAVVELDRAAETPVDVLVHGKRVARGEIVVVDDFYAVRVTSVGD